MQIGFNDSAPLLLANCLPPLPPLPFFNDYWSAWHMIIWATTFAITSLTYNITHRLENKFNVHKFNVHSMYCGHYQVLLTSFKFEAYKMTSS